MTNSERRGNPRFAAVLIVCAAVFVALLLVIEPIGDGLVARGVPNAVVGAGLTLVLAVLFGLPLVTYLVGRARRHREESVSARARLESWAANAGWRPGAAPGADPYVLERFHLRSSQPVTVATGQVSGFASSLTLWQQTFANTGSPVTAPALWLVLIVDGLPRGARFGMGKIGGIRSFGRMPTRLAGYPPVSLARSAAARPWGFAEVSVWPGVDVPPPPAWAGVAQELDATFGWLLLHDGRLEIAVRADLADVPPERMIRLADHSIRLSHGQTLR